MVLGEDFGKVPAEAEDRAEGTASTRFDILRWVMARINLAEVDGDRAIADPLGHWHEVEP